VSFVEQLPSTSSRSKVCSVAARRTASNVSSSTVASVVSTASMVARLGAIMPAPLAKPPTVHPSGCLTAVCLGTVSVVITARAASRPACLVSASAAVAASTPASSAAIGSRSPIRPVEHTPTSIAPMSSRLATRSAVAWVSWNPSGPVHALAPPEFSTTARSRRWTSACLVHSTGAALTLLRVNTPAAVSRGPSLTSRARSFSPLALMPAATPAARNPPGAVAPASLVTLIGPLPHSLGQLRPS
jgi:hypothetical protein